MLLYFSSFHQHETWQKVHCKPSISRVLDATMDSPPKRETCQGLEIAFVQSCQQTVTLVRNRQTVCSRLQIFLVAKTFGPAFQILPAVFRNAKDFPVALPLQPDSYQNRTCLDFPSAYLSRTRPALVRNPRS